MGGGKKSPAPPQLQAPREVPLSETFSKFLEQRGQLPSLSDFASQINTDFRQQLERGLPGTIGAAAQTSNLVNQLLSGTPSADVQSFAQRQFAERNLAAGLPATSEAARFGEAASYGQLSSQLQQQGMAAVPGLMQLSEFLNPQQAQNYLFSTGQLRGEELKAAQDAANVANQNAMNKYNYDVQQSQSKGGFLGTIGGLVGGVAGFAAGGPMGASLGATLGGGLGSLAGGGSFSAPAQASQFGGLIGNAGAGIMGSGFNGLMSGGGLGGTPTFFSPSGTAYTVPSTSYATPLYSRNMIYDALAPSTPTNFGSNPGYFPTL